MTYLFSLAVAVGGVIWAWMYEKTGSLYGPRVSHALVDTVIFIVGYDLLVKRGRSLANAVQTCDSLTLRPL